MLRKSKHVDDYFQEFSDSMVSMMHRYSAAQVEGDGRRAAIYVRSATYDEQKTLEQEAICRQYARSRGYDVQGVFVDNGRAGNSSNPALTNLLDATRQGVFDVVVVVDLSRLARSTIVTVHVQETLSDANVRIEFARNV